MPKVRFTGHSRHNIDSLKGARKRDFSRRGPALFPLIDGDGKLKFAMVIPAQRHDWEHAENPESE